MSVTIGSLIGAGWVQAQSPIDVTSDDIISEYENAGGAQVLVDPWGTIHVFYIAWLGDATPRRGARNAILHVSQQESEGWTEPVDILVSSEGVRIACVLYQDSTNLLFVLWRDDQGVYLSTAPIAGLDVVQSWSTETLLLGNSYWPNMIIDAQNVFHLVYEVDSHSIYYIQFTDQTQTWSAPQLIATTQSWNEAYSDLNAVLDKSGYLHLVWHEATEENEWNPVAVWYARSVDSGKSWQITEMGRVTAPERLGQIHASLGAEDRPYLTWNYSGRCSLGRGRGFNWSEDSGTTWALREHLEILPECGLSGWSFVVVDSAGRQHLIVPGGGSINYARWEGIGWTFPVQLLVGEFPQVAISNGNLIHIVCTSYDEGRIPYVRIETDAPYIPSRSDPLPPFDVVNASATVAITEMLSPTPRIERLNQDRSIGVEPPGAQLGSSLSPVLWGSVVAMLMVGSAFIAWLFKTSSARFK